MEESIEWGQYFPLIEHRQNEGVLRVAKYYAQIILDWIYPQRDTKGIENILNENPVVIAGSHLSQFDWVIHKVTAFDNDVKLAVSAGDNLFLPFIGKILRECCAFKYYRPENGQKEVPKDVMKGLWGQYVNKLIKEGEFDVLVFPGVVRNGSQKKYGRSYNGELSEFSAAFFLLMNRIQRGLEEDLLIVPGNISYERVHEDEQIGRIKKLREKKIPGWLIYTYDFLHMLVGRAFRHKSRYTAQYGEPLRVQDYSPRELRTVTRRAVAKLQTVYPTHALAHALRESEVEEQIKRDRDRFRAAGMNTHPIEGDVGAVVERAMAQFGLSRYDDLNPEMRRYYRNQVESPLRILEGE